MLLYEAAILMSLMSDDTKILLQCINLTKPVRLTDVRCAFLKINGEIWLKLYGIVRFVHCIDLFLSMTHGLTERVIACCGFNFAAKRSFRSALTIIFPPTSSPGLQAGQSSKAR